MVVGSPHIEPNETPFDGISLKSSEKGLGTLFIEIRDKCYGLIIHVIVVMAIVPCHVSP